MLLPLGQLEPGRDEMFPSHGPRPNSREPKNLEPKNLEPLEPWNL
jgi:hypothetical protein